MSDEYRKALESAGAELPTDRLEGGGLSHDKRALRRQFAVAAMGVVLGAVYAAGKQERHEPDEVAKVVWDIADAMVRGEP